MSTLLRRLGIAVAIILLVLAVAAGTGWGASERRLTRKFEVRDETVIVGADSAAVARGRHVAVAIAKCVDCHGEDFGGRVLLDHPALGRLAGPNLTTGRGGLGAARTLGEIERAVRHGVAPNRRPLIFMPSDDYSAMSDADFGALVAYLRTMPPVDRDVPRSELRALGRALLVAGKMPVLAAERIGAGVRHAMPTADRSADYGQYLAGVAGCTGCHGPGLSGGAVPGTPPEFKPARNITPEGIGSWTEADFTRALRDGMRPDGTPIDEFMPVRYTKQMTDDEIAALWAFLKTVPPRPYGRR